MEPADINPLEVKATTIKPVIVGDHSVEKDKGKDKITGDEEEEVVPRNKHLKGSELSSQLGLTHSPAILPDPVTGAPEFIANRSKVGNPATIKIPASAIESNDPLVVYLQEHVPDKISKTEAAEKGDKQLAHFDDNCAQLKTGTHSGLQSAKGAISQGIDFVDTGLTDGVENFKKASHTAYEEVTVVFAEVKHELVVAAAKTAAGIEYVGKDVIPPAVEGVRLSAVDAINHNLGAGFLTSLENYRVRAGNAIWNVIPDYNAYLGYKTPAKITSPEETEASLRKEVQDKTGKGRADRDKGIIVDVADMEFGRLIDDYDRSVRATMNNMEKAYYLCIVGNNTKIEEERERLKAYCDNVVQFLQQTLAYVKEMKKQVEDISTAPETSTATVEGSSSGTTAEIKTKDEREDIRSREALLEMHLDRRVYEVNLKRKEYDEMNPSDFSAKFEKDHPNAVQPKVVTTIPAIEPAPTSTGGSSSSSSGAAIVQSSGAVSSDV